MFEARVLLALIAAAFTASPTSAEPADGPATLAAAMQWAYYDELDLDIYQSLEKSYGERARVIPSDNVIQVGEMAVTAKLVVPRSTAPAEVGLFASNDPHPVRIMLDYALVSCRSGCRVSMVSDASGTPTAYKARHHSIEAKGFGGAPVGIGSDRRSERVASMVLIEGRRAIAAIDQINASRRVDVYLTAAVHGPMRFTFKTADHVSDSRL